MDERCRLRGRCSIRIRGECSVLEKTEGKLDKKSGKETGMEKKRIIVGASGASGMPILAECLQIIRQAPQYESCLIMTKSAVLTLEQETSYGK